MKNIHISVTVKKQIHRLAQDSGIKTKDALYLGIRELLKKQGKNYSILLELELDELIEEKEQKLKKTKSDVLLNQMLPIEEINKILSEIETKYNTEIKSKGEELNKQLEIEKNIEKNKEDLILSKLISIKKLSNTKEYNSISNS